MESKRSFWWRCAKIAHRGTPSFANDWQWVYGFPAVAALLTVISSWLKVSAVTTGYPILDGFLIGAGAFAVTYVVRFVPRFVAAPFRLYSAQKRHADALHRELQPASDERISILDLASVAEHDFGWDFSSGWQVLDLTNGLEHAANDGLVKLEGKVMGAFGAPPLDPFRRSRFLFTPIDREDWLKRKLRISIPGVSFKDADNFDIMVCALLEEKLRYYDVHITSGRAAINWLKREGSKRKGQNEQWHLEGEARRLRLRSESPFADTGQGTADVPRQIPFA